MNFDTCFVIKFTSYKVFVDFNCLYRQNSYNFTYDLLCFSFSDEKLLTVSEGAIFYFRVAQKKRVDEEHVYFMRIASD